MYPRGLSEGRENLKYKANDAKQRNGGVLTLVKHKIPFEYVRKSHTGGAELQQLQLKLLQQHGTGVI